MKREALQDFHVIIKNSDCPKRSTEHEEFAATCECCSESSFKMEISWKDRAHVSTIPDIQELGDAASGFNVQGSSKGLGFRVYGSDLIEQF